MVGGGLSPLCKLYRQAVLLTRGGRAAQRTLNRELRGHTARQPRGAAWGAEGGKAISPQGLFCVPCVRSHPRVVQAHLTGSAGLVPCHHNKMSTAVTPAT